MACGNVAVKPPSPTQDLPDKATSPWAVQLTGDRSEVKALAAYRLLQKKHEAILGNYQPVVIRTILKMGAAPYGVGCASRQTAAKPPKCFARGCEPSVKLASFKGAEAGGVLNFV